MSIKSKIRVVKKAMKYLKSNGIKNSVIKLKLKIYSKKNLDSINSNYLDWIKNNEPSTKIIDLQRKKKFKIEPKLSIIIPMYNTNKQFFYELVCSLKAQTYSNFEVCLADGSLNVDAEILNMFENDKRFIYKHLEKNGGISKNTNEALEMSTGQYIVLIDHDDLIPPFCLYEIVKSINENTEAEFIYTDEDNIDSNNERKNPHFKPDFSPDTLRSYNYICHLSVYSKKIIEKVGKFNESLDGAQDYDMILRVSEATDKIIHIPKILYHWRLHENSTAMSSCSKTYTDDAGCMAIKAHLDRIGLAGKVSILDTPGRYKVEYEICNSPKVSIIIPNKNSKSELKKCLNSVLESSYKNIEIIIVENNSTKKDIFEYYKEIESNKNIKIVYFEENEFNYSKINNLGVSNSTGEYIILLNNDTQVIEKRWIEEMLGICQRNDVGIVGAKLLYFDNTVQHAGVVLGMGSIAGHVNINIKDIDQGYFSRANIINNYSAVTAACLMTKRAIYNEVNGLTEGFKVAFNDIDYCMKVVNKGYLVVYTPYAKLYHYESKTRGYEDTPEKIKRFQSEIELFKKNWGDEIKKGDKYFNKNFRLDQPNFVINVNKNE
ncbi:MAG: glycosyltransferase family 2 protein [Clostridia bacterium]